MNPWPFVISAYAITLIGTVLTSVWAWRSAVDAEKRADALGTRADRERD